jgi:hypothetical protein
VLCPVLRGLVDEVRTAVMLYDTRWKIKISWTINGSAYGILK